MIPCIEGPWRVCLPAGLFLFLSTPFASAAGPRSTGAAPAAPPAAQDPAAGEVEIHHGEPLDHALYGPGVVESMEVALERDRLHPEGSEVADPDAGEEDGPGAWVVPSRDAMSVPHSGSMHAINEGGALSLGIGFGEPIDLTGAWIGGQSDAGAWARGVRAVGYRDGVETGETGWFSPLGAEPRWFAIDLKGIDRVVFEAQPAFDVRGWYTLDDLTYVRTVGGRDGVPAQSRSVVVDFEDARYGQKLSGSKYAGLDWEVGAPPPEQEGVHAPERPPGAGGELTGEGPAPLPLPLGGSGTAPNLISDFQTSKQGDHGSSTYPPDTCGAIGPNHFVVVINRVFSVYDRNTGSEVLGMNLASFLPGSNGDPRVHYDPHSGRWIITVGDFNTKIYLAVSTSSNPLGSWFKTNFVISQGSDSGCWADYPTMGVDANGIYVAGYMVGCNSMSLFAIDKAPLIQATPSLGTVTAFRNLPYEGALQPCVTYGDPGGEYVVSATGTNQVRIRRVDPPLANPTLTTVSTLTVGSHADPPNAPALGSTVNISTVDGRMMNAVYRDGSIWCAHNVSQSSKAACRWYELGTAPYALIQSGTVTDSVLHYYFPGITVNANGDVGMGFSGSSSSQYVGAYFTGRLAIDPPGEMGPPVQYRAGQAPQNNIDGAGRNRWGDYSLSNIDPADDTTLWTIQEYAQATDVWGTHVASFEYPVGPSCQDPVVYCVTSPNSVGAGMLIGATGSTSVTMQDLTLYALEGPPNKPGVFYYGAAQVQLPFGNGVRCVGSGGIGTFRLAVVQSDAFGDAVYTIEWNVPPACCGNGAFVSGDEWNFQYWYRDPAAGGANFNFSDAVDIVFCD